MTSKSTSCLSLDQCNYTLHLPASDLSLLILGLDHLSESEHSLPHVLALRAYLKSQVELTNSGLLTPSTRAGLLVQGKQLLSSLY